MMKFKQFKQQLTEQTDDTLPVDNRHLENNLDALNKELDALTERPYKNAPIMLVQMRGVLERYAIQLPASATNNFLDLGGEMMYDLGTSGYHLYIVYDSNDEGYVEGYAQVVTQDELDDLKSMDDDFFMKNVRINRPWSAPAKRDDDSGNTDEY